MKLFFGIGLVLMSMMSSFYGFLNAVYADDLGVHGRVYPIQENDLLSLLKSRAQAEVNSGQWEKRVDEWRAQAKQQANRPHGIHLPRALKTTSHLYDPSVIVADAIKDTRGQVIHAAGSSVNPLSYVSMTRHLVFIDGDDQAQVDWMMQMTAKEPDRYKVILTRGDVVDLMKLLKRRLYFDQRQVYSHKLAIKSLPALVYQQGLYLRIDEVAI